MGKYNFSFLLTSIVFLVAFVGLTFIIFDLHRYFFIGEFILLAAFILAALIGMAAVYFDKSWGWTWLAVLSVLALIDILFIYMMTKTKSFALTPAVVASVITLVISLFSLGGDDEEEIEAVEARPIGAEEKEEKKSARRGRKGKDKVMRNF